MLAEVSHPKAHLGWMFEKVSSQGWQLMLAVSSTGALNKHLRVTFPHGLGFSQHGDAPRLTTGFLEAATLLPILFVRGVTEPAQIQGSGAIGSTS